MTAEQLEELLKDAYTPGYRNRFRELQNMAPSLARRVIAAEKLLKAAEDVSRCGASTGPQWTKLAIGILKYREASK